MRERKRPSAVTRRFFVPVLFRHFLASFSKRLENLVVFVLENQVPKMVVVIDKHPVLLSRVHFDYVFVVISITTLFLLFNVPQMFSQKCLHERVFPHLKRVVPDAFQSQREHVLALGVVLKVTLLFFLLFLVLFAFEQIEQTRWYHS